MRVRNAIFWLHLVMAVGAGSVIFLMSATGVLLMYERQITEWAERGYRSAPPSAGAARLSAETLISRAAAEQTGTPPSSLTMQVDSTAAATVSFGRERTLFVDVYSGRVLGEGSTNVRAFFRSVTAWHRWLGMQGGGRETGGRIVKVCNFIFLAIVVSGLYLWLPRKWTWTQVRNVTWFRRGLAGKARDFNWHNVVGLWAWLPLFLIVFSGVVMTVRAGGPPAQGGRTERREHQDGPRLDGLDELWALAERRAPDWRSITLRVPDEADAPVSFTILRGSRARPDLRAQLTLDRQSREVVRWEPYASQSAGRRLRSWSRWVHTGEAGGFLGQTIAGVASAGATLLVWTGWAMAWRRFFSGKKNSVSAESDARLAREVS